MRCISPILAKGTTKMDPTWVPCSRCGYCLATRQISWSFRLQEEFEQSKFPALFLTLTYDNENLPWTLDECPIIRKHFGLLLDEPTLLTRDVQLFNKSLRKENAKHTEEQYRYYAAGEYGETYGRPHYHLIMFNVHPETITRITSFWKHGLLDLRYCDGKKAVYAYVANYVVNGYSQALRVNKRPFSLMSKRPYIGHSYVVRMYDYHKRNEIAYLERGEKKMALPRIFKNKIFTTAELNAMKQPAVEQHEMKLANELHRLRLKNGPDYDGFKYIEKQRIYWEQDYKQKAKHNDKHEFRKGTLRSSIPIGERLNRAFKSAE
ncbi:MAG: replication initiator protein [Microviridae sp.]|nr:MAG: replication initiator protein [Microviridae sp.]